MFDLLHKNFESSLAAIKDSGRLSDMVAGMFPYIASHGSTLSQ